MAGAIGGDDDDEGITQINVVPLVDIMLVLLIIFMVSTEFVQHELKNRIPPNIPIELPKAASAEDTEPSLLSLIMNKDGLLFLNGKESSMEGVHAYIDQMRASGTTKMQAVIAADERLTHGKVMGLVDVIRLWGIDDLVINTKPQEIE